MVHQRVEGFSTGKPADGYQPYAKDRPPSEEDGEYVRDVWRQCKGTGLEEQIYGPLLGVLSP